MSDVHNQALINKLSEQRNWHANDAADWYAKCAELQIQVKTLSAALEEKQEEIQRLKRAAGSEAGGTVGLAVVENAGDDGTQASVSE